MSIINSVLQLIDSIISNILIALRLKENLIIENNMHLINIRYGQQNNTFALSLTPEMTVEDLKKQLVTKIDVNLWSDIVIIFSGKELPNDLRLSDCDLGQNSVIHAINSLNIKTKTKLLPFSQQNISQKLTNLNIDSEEIRLALRQNELNFDKTIKEKSLKNCYYFVYCNSCKQLMNGKLRVVCDQCKNGTITLDRDPKQWNDVIIGGRITGVCQSEDCNGTVAKFYFKCASTLHKNEEKANNFDSNRAVVLYLIRNNSIRVSCLACTDIKDTVLVFPCSSGHVICLDCFKDYCLSRLNERKFIIDSEIGYSLGCAVGCPQSLIEETHHFRLMGETAYEKYQLFGAEECVLQSGGVLCPQPRCGAGILLDGWEEKNADKCTRITCNSCGFVFCRKCLQGYHIDDCLFGDCESSPLGATSSSYRDLDSSNADKSKWNENMSRSAIKELTKPCPKCRTPTERDGGCMHMVCTRAQCGFSWCWVCQTEWNRECMANHWFG
jgi:parkin